MYSDGPPHTAEQKQDDQLEHTFSSYVRIRDVALKTCLRRWTIGRSGEKGSGIFALAAWHDDDDIYLISIIVMLTAWSKPTLSRHLCLSFVAGPLDCIRFPHRTIECKSFKKFKIVRTPPFCGPFCFYSPCQNVIHPQESIWTTLRSPVQWSTWCSDFCSSTIKEFMKENK